MTSTGTVSRNTVNVYGGGVCREGAVIGGGIFSSGCAESNTVNIYKDFSCESVYGGVVRTGTSSFNTVTVFSNSNLNIFGSNEDGVYGGRVDKDGISMNNSVNVYGRITTQGEVNIFGGNVNIGGSADSNSVIISGNIHSGRELMLYGGSVGNNGSANSNCIDISGHTQSNGELKMYGGYVNGDGNSNDNRVNISGNIEAEGDIDITGGKGDDTAGNVVSISGKIGSSGGGTVTIAGSYAAKSAVNNKVIIYETAEIPDTCVLYGDRLAITFSGNSLEIFFNKRLRVETVDSFQNYKFILLEGIKAGDTILSFHDSDELRTTFNVEDVDIKILLSPKTGLNVKDKVLMHCDRGFRGSVSSVPVVGVYNGLALECRSEFGLALSKDSNKDIIATLSSKEVNARAEAKSYSEAVSGALVFENQGGDIIAQEAMEEVGKLGEKVGTFGVMTYGNSKYKRGTAVDVKGIGVVGGVGKRVERKEEEVWYGVSCEYGTGEYKAENRIGIEEVKARGENEYIGEVY